MVHPLDKRLRPGRRPQNEENRLVAFRRSVLERIERGELSPPPPLKAYGPRLRPEEERELSERIRTWGCFEARDVLVTRNIGLIHDQIGWLKSARPDIYEDVLQEAHLGLMRAAETFDGSRGLRFGTYAVHWIRAKAQRCVQDAERHDEPTVPGARSAFWSDDPITGKRTRNRHRVLRLDAAVLLDGESDQTLADVVPAAGPTPEDEVVEWDELAVAAEAIEEAIASMKPKEQPRMRTLLRGRLEGKTLTAIGVDLDITREGVRQKEIVLFEAIRRAANKLGRRPAA